MKKPPQRDPIRAHRRKVTAERCAGVGAKCEQCGETRPKALIPGSIPKICAECQRKKKGHKTMDNHHFAGSANNPLTVPVPTNDHRAELTVEQDGWPPETRDNPTSSPLLAAAGCIRGFVDWVVYLIQKGVLWVAEMLEALNKFLVDKHGSTWWVGTPVERFAPKQSK